ncbi:hypothetical protein PIB30_019097 [Stylosanthes scabra]|uniref:Uncharacterized protein n=1 Tax=Stylosanthes scabra TaxID=79078 RepID=A0ABU6U715_9FABA|nr:hypothetical protein [Stylosanthes scabra]
MEGKFPLRGYDPYNSSFFAFVNYDSFENQSQKSRHAYSLHVVDTDGCKWAPENWIQRKVEPEPLYVS